MVVVVVMVEVGTRLGCALSLLLSLMVVTGLRVVGWGCGSLFPTHNVVIIYVLNNIIYKCPVSLGVWCIVLQ